MGIICETCGRDIDALGQDNMGVGAPLCEDCWNEQQGRAAESLRREVRNLRFENARLREKLDAATEETAVQNLRKGIETAYEVSRERALGSRSWTSASCGWVAASPRRRRRPLRAARPRRRPCLASRPTRRAASRCPT